MPVMKVYNATTSQWEDVGAGGLTNPMTTAGDIIYGGTSGAPTRLAKGTDGQVLTLASGLPSWAAASGSGAIDWANPISVTGATTLSIGRHHVCSGTTADYTVTLPAVSGNAGKLISIEMSGALTKLVTVDGNGSETIDGATTRVMWARETAVLLCDGAQWTKIGGKSIPMMSGLYEVSSLDFNAATFTKILTNTSLYNLAPDGFQDTTNSKFVCKRTAKMMVIQNGRWNGNNTTAARSILMVYKDGANVGNASYTVPANTVNNTQAVSMIDVTSGSVLEYYAYFDAGDYTTTVLTAGANATFWIVQEIPQW